MRANTLRPHWRIWTAIAALAIGGALAPASAAYAATTICSQFGEASVDGGRYIVNNNEWNDTITQCINVGNDGFSVTTGNHNKPTNGAPSGYPSIYAGCHYGNCSSSSGLPLRVSSFGNTRSSVNFATAAGQWDAAYDIWEGRATNAGISWNVVSYVRQSTTNAISVTLRDFTNDSVSRGFMSTAWFLTSVQFGFEPWQGGPGLGVNSFSFNAN